MKTPFIRCVLPVALAALLSGCGEWPETRVDVPDGPWPSLVPLSGLDVTSGATTTEADIDALIDEGERLSTRAERLRGRPATAARVGRLSDRAAILRGNAETPEAREAMRARLGTLPGA